MSFLSQHKKFLFYSTLTYKNKDMSSLLAIVFFAFGAFASGEEEVLTQINKAMATLKAAPLMAAPCKMSPDGTCSYAQMCQELQANRNSRILYKDSAGKILPNYNLMATYGALATCRDTLKKEQDDDDDTSAKPSTVGDQKWAADQKKFQQLKEGLLKSIRQHNEQNKYLSMEDAMTTYAVDNNLSSTVASSKTAADKFVRAMEAKAKVHLSPETRSKWVTLLDPANYTSTQPTNTPDQDAFVAENPFLNPSLLIDAAHAGSPEKLRKYQDMYKKENARMESLFHETQTRIIALLQARKNGQNNEQMDELIKRVNTVKYKPLDKFDPDYLKEAGCDYPNAFYASDVHAFTMCTQFMIEPDASVLATMAHEIGHSIDPCTLADGLYPNADKNGYTTEPDDDEANEFAKDYGFSENPMSSVVSCLASKNSVGARLANIDLVRKNLQTKMQYLRNKGATETSPEITSLKTTLTNLDQSFSEHRACSELPGKSEMQEAFADWVSSKVVAKKVSELPEDQQKAYAVIAQGSFLETECVTIKPDAVANMDKAIEGTSCDPGVYNRDVANINAAVAKDEHPDSSIRVNRIYMAEPEYRKALKCSEKSEAVSCD